MRAFLFFAVFTLAVPVRPDISPKEEKPAAPPLLGDWQVLKVIIGEKQDTDDADGTVFTFTPNDIQIRKKGERRPEHDASYTVDWTKTPTAIDFTPKNNGREMKIGGILKIEGDQLTLCYTIGPNENRPRDFVVAPNLSTVMIQLKRITK